MYQFNPGVTLNGASVGHSSPAHHSPSVDTQIVQDLLPGTGSLGSVPMHHVCDLVVYLSATF